MPLIETLIQVGIEEYTPKGVASRSFEPVAEGWTEEGAVSDALERFAQLARENYSYRFNIRDRNVKLIPMFSEPAILEPTVEVREEVESVA